MNRNAFPMRLAGLAGLLVAFVLVAGAWSTAQARIHSLSGDARFQIGDGLPIPIALVPVPNGPVPVVPGATIRQHGHHLSTDPAKIVIDPTQLSFNAAPVNIPVFNSNPNVFQVKTNLTLMWPKEKISFVELGRTGPAVVSFCAKPPSTTIIQAGGNPACMGSPTGTGQLIYTATAHQFGGPAQGLVAGTADVALKLILSAPCAGAGCRIGFFNAGPASMGAVGAAFGFSNNTVPTAPSPGVYTNATVAANGSVVSVGTPIAPGLTNAGTEWGGPWTTGMLTASAPEAIPPEKFTLTGADARTVGSTGQSEEGGQGAISLVAGSVSQRSISGPNANRGWLNFTIGPKVSHIPFMPIYGVAALVGLTALSGAYVLRRRSK